MIHIPFIVILVCYFGYFLTLRTPKAPAVNRLYLFDFLRLVGACEIC